MPKTPDVRLRVPIMVNDHFLVNCIESKASFGDAATVRRSLAEQFAGYTRLFGPGMVIYWNGVVSDADYGADARHDVLIVGAFPRKVAIFS